jgi:hypothetical protein
VVARAKLSCNQLAALRGREARQKKQERHTSDKGCEQPLLHNSSFLPL